MSGQAELRIAALSHAIECYAGPPDDTLLVLRAWLREIACGGMDPCYPGTCQLPKGHPGGCFGDVDVDA